MKGAILSIGDELALGQTLDTNGQWLAEALQGHGIETIEHRTVADDRAQIARAVDELASSVEVLVSTGGLGPTADDLTREALGDLLTPDRPLVVDADMEIALRAWFAGRGVVMPERNLMQATRPAVMKCLANPHGTAPGLTGEHRGCRLFIMPGPPREMRPMFERFVAPAVSGGAGDLVLRTATVHAYGLGESAAAERFGDLMRRDRVPIVGTTVREGILSARVRAKGAASDVEASVQATAGEVERRWAPYAFGSDGTTLGGAVNAVVKSHGLMLTTAESCTGGWLGKSLVDTPGSSASYIGGWVTYSNEMKMSCLGVERAALEQEGAVSETVAAMMARGALAASGADVAVSITGIAGPEPSEGGKPAGLVYIGLAGGARAGGAFDDQVRRFRFRGDRTVVRDRSVKSALQMVRCALIGAAGTPLLWEDGGAGGR